MINFKAPKQRILHKYFHRNYALRHFFFTSFCCYLLFIHQEVLAVTDNECATQNSDTECADSESNIPPSLSSTHDDADESALLKDLLKNDEKSLIANSNCNMFLATSSIPNSGLGLFTAIDIPKHIPIARPDIVIQVPDSHPAYDFNLKIWLNDYAWDGSESGGQNEGLTRVSSAMPGVAMLANGHPEGYNALPFKPTVDEADLPRTTSPGSGAISHYYNFSFYSQAAIQAGNEIFVNYGRSWFEERGIGMSTDESAKSNEKKISGRSVQWLQKNGRCVDNLEVKRSKLPDAGRGAFATRPMSRGSIITSTPLVQIPHRYGLMMSRTVKEGKKNKIIEAQQLMMNYCYGYPNSTILLFPYAPVVNFINHGGEDDHNAIVRWSTIKKPHHNPPWLTETVDELAKHKKTGLMFDIIAKRDIEINEEVTIDYGVEWENAWNDHIESWEPPPNSEKYSPSYVFNEVVSKIRTVEEQKSFPYPENLQTACFYSYERYKNDKNNPDKNFAAGKIGEGVTAIRWKYSRGLLEFVFLRPCHIVARDDAKMLYMAVMRNAPYTKDEEMIPKEIGNHFVSHIPRQAIRFVDKPYTTDQHLPNAFRHFIGIPDDIFPPSWFLEE